MSNIFGRIKDFIVNNVKGLVKIDKKATYLSSFVDLLIANNVSGEVIDELKVSFMKNLGHISDDNNLELISNIVWLTLMSHVEKSTLFINSFEEIGVDDVIVYGLPGSGKTTFVVKYLNGLGIKRVNYKSTNPNDDVLLTSWSDAVPHNSVVSLSIRETNVPTVVDEWLSVNYKSKIVFVVDVCATYEVVRDVLIKSS